jgi:Putative prokaryotic signal transducing protein
MSNLVAVAAFGTHIEADLARSALEAAGIDAMTAADDAGGQRPHLAFSQGVVVLVREENAAAAREVLLAPRP